MTRKPYEKLAYQRVGPTVIDRLLQQHKATWGYDWPHGRGYIAELYLEAKQSLGIPASSKERPEEVAKATLTLMRESHHFPDHPAPFGSGGAN